MRPASDAELALEILEGGHTDIELLARVLHGEVEVTRDIMPLQLLYPLPLQNEIQLRTLLYELITCIVSNLMLSHMNLGLHEIYISEILFYGIG